MKSQQKKEKERNKKIIGGVIFLLVYYFVNALIMTIQNLQFILTIEWWGLNGLAAIGCILIFLGYHKITD